MQYHQGSLGDYPRLECTTNYFVCSFSLPLMSIRYCEFCRLKAAEVLGERWTILIIRELLLGTTRFNDFQRALSRISPTLLTKRLNQLQECGLVVRKTVPDQRRKEYQPMPAAKEIKPIILGL